MIKVTGNNTLVITQGDTGTLNVSVTGATLGSSDMAQLTVTDKKRNEVLQKIAAFADNVATILFANGDTANLPADVYLWELRIVTGATVSEGKITGGTDIITPFEDAQPMRIVDALGDIGATEGA